MGKGKKIWIIGIVSVIAVMTVFIVGLLMADPLNMEEVDQVFSKDKGYNYFYSKLNEEEQYNYRRLYYSIYMCNEDVMLKDVNIDKATTIYNSILYDHPEFFHLGLEFEYVEERDNITIYPIYDYQKEEIKQYNEKIKKNSEKIIKEAKSQKNDLNKIKTIYDYLIENIEFAYSKNDQNILSALIDKKTVCAGYARAYQYLLERVGIECSYIPGKTKIDQNNPQEEGHAWLMIHLNDNYYYSDPTWGDVVDEGLKHTCYGYFLMNSDEMLQCYQPDDYYEKSMNNGLDYFKENRLYMEKYDKNILSYAIKRAVSNKEHIAEVKCANEQVYNQVKNKLQNSYLGYEVLSQNHCYKEGSRYYCDDKLKLVELHF